MEKTTRKARTPSSAGAQQRRKIEAVGELRTGLPMRVAEVDAMKKRVSNIPRAMLLVNDVLSPRDAESAALALCDLVGLLCETHKKADRIELDFYCSVQAVLHLEDWEEHLRMVITTIRNQRTKKK
jgi:hypothetical protein